MALEIERKFLLCDESWRHGAGPGVALRQGYLNDVTAGSGSRASVRVRVGGGRGWLNIKSVTLDIERLEFEYEIPVDDAQQLLDELCGGRIVDKTRFSVRYGAHLWEIDVFHGLNEGLVVAELELSARDEQYEPPPWLGKEISGDARYYNVSLARNPFSAWS
jgi:adenylate cyclase